MAVAARHTLPPQREGHPRQTRHRSAETPHRDLHQRLFLARARRLQQIRYAEIKCRILGKEDPHKQSPRREELPHPAGNRLEGNRNLGMPAETDRYRRDDERGREIPSPHWRREQKG